MDILFSSSQALKTVTKNVNDKEPCLGVVQFV